MMKPAAGQHGRWQTWPLANMAAGKHGRWPTWPLANMAAGRQAGSYFNFQDASKR